MKLIRLSLPSIPATASCGNLKFISVPFVARLWSTFVSEFVSAVGPQISCDPASVCTGPILSEMASPFLRPSTDAFVFNPIATFAFTEYTPGLKCPPLVFSLPLICLQ